MGNVYIRMGDIFEGGMDVTVLPCSAKGTISSATARRVTDYGLQNPQQLNLKLRLGEISDLIPFPAVNGVTKYIVYAASVFNDFSSAEAIENIAIQLGNITRTHPEIRSIEVPLLGTGAGRLEPEIAGQSLHDGFKSSSRSDAILYVFVFDHARLTKITNQINGISPSNVNLRVFVSSKMVELREERSLIYASLPPLLNGIVGLQGWIYESDAPASIDTVRQVYLDALKDSSLYVGIFGNEYGEWTIDEFERATEWGIDQLIFVKDVDAYKRDPRLTEFLSRVSTVTSGPASKWFKNNGELRSALEKSIEVWLIKRLKNDKNRRERLYHLEVHRKPLWDAFTEYNAYLTKYPDARYRDEAWHSKIIRDAIRTCLAINDSLDASGEACLKIDAGSRGFVQCSQKYENNLKYIANKRLTPFCVDESTAGKQQKAEVKRWGWYGNRNLNALQSATERLQKLISEAQ